jgi:hypothetical protein
MKLTNAGIAIRGYASNIIRACVPCSILPASAVGNPNPDIEF